MDTTFIKGSKEIESHFGYFPSFHDDYIDSIEITGEAIVLCIRMECSEANLKPNAKERVKLTLEKPKKFSLEGEFYGCVSIVFDITFEKHDEEIVTKFTTALGTELVDERMSVLTAYVVAGVIGYDSEKSNILL